MSELISIARVRKNALRNMGPGFDPTVRAEVMLALVEAVEAAEQHRAYMHGLWLRGEDAKRYMKADGDGSASALRRDHALARFDFEEEPYESFAASQGANFDAPFDGEAT